MDVAGYISQLKAERDRIDAAIEALQSINGNTPASEEPVKRAYTRRAPVVAAKQNGRKGWSAASRKRLSEAMKQRWAARKSRTKKGPRLMKAA